MAVFSCKGGICLPLSIIKTGLALSGFEKYIDEVKNYVAPDGSRKLILMVPDRFSYNAEKLICDELGGTGFNGVNVYTINKFIRKNSSEADKALLNEGKQMLLRRIINKTIDESSVFYGAKDKAGFIESVLEVIEDWKRFCVDVDDVCNEIEALPEGITRHKLSVIKDVFEAYRNEFMTNGYKDEADLLLDVADSIKIDKSYSDAVVWIDGFVEFVPAELEIISAFLSVGADVRVYLPCKLQSKSDSDGIYSVPQRTLYNLVELCGVNGYVYNVSEEIPKHDENEAIPFLCSTYDDNDEVFKGGVDSVIIREYDDIYEEVEGVASEIVRLVSEKGFKFSDVSLLCGDLNEYTSCIEAVFSRYSIPYFSDYKIPLINHPISILLTSVFELVKKRSFPVSHMVRYLKTGYILNSVDSTDMLTLYIRKRGVKAGMWKDDKYFETFPTGFFDEAIGRKNRKNSHSEWLKSLRRTVYEPLSAFYEKTKGRLSVKAHATAFFEYLSDIDLFGSIEKNIEFFESIGDENEAARLTHVWNLIVNLFNQMVTMSGDEKITRSVFGEYLKAGIEASEISIIPTVQNGVSVSDAGHRKGSGVRALFVIGATRDSVPAVKREDGLISENELEGLKSLPVSVGKSYRNLSKEFELVTAFSESSELLYVSWCSMGPTGEKKIKSPLFDTLKQKFPELEFSHSVSEYIVASPQSMLHKVLVRIANDKELGEYDKAVKEWFAERDEWKSAISLLDEAEKYNQIRGLISKDIAAKLYKQLASYSVSRLEKYFKCPFMYFLSYGLNLDDNDEFGLKSTDTGNVVHHALAEFCLLVEKGTETISDKRSRWNEITNELRDEYINTVMNSIIEKSGYNVDEDAKLKSVFTRMSETVTKAADMIILMLRKGKFDIYANEEKFDDFTVDGASGKVLFNGIIDRIDVYEDNGVTKIRIIDYKTGDKKFNLKDVLNGVDLQLIVYAMAAERMLGKGAEIAGFFYNSIKKRIADCDDPEKAASEVAKLYKLVGTVVERETDDILQVQTGADMDSDLVQTGESLFLPVKLTAKGVYDKRYSSVNSSDVMSEIYRNVRETVSEGVSALESGDVRVYPYVANGNDSCRFCPYTSVCMYDKCRGAEVNKGEKGKSVLSSINDNK